MQRLIDRTFEVDAPLDRAWQGLAQVERWPEWAGHISAVERDPPGPLTSLSSGTLHLRGAPRSKFTMRAWDPPNHWLWAGRFLWLALRYDHRFEPVSANRTRLIWTVDAEGPGVGTLGPLFAAVYRRNLNRAIPSLQHWFADQRDRPPAR